MAAPPPAPAIQPPPPAAANPAAQGFLHEYDPAAENAPPPPRARAAGADGQRRPVTLLAKTRNNAAENVVEALSGKHLAQALNENSKNDIMAQLQIAQMNVAASLQAANMQAQALITLGMQMSNGMIRAAQVPYLMGPGGQGAGQVVQGGQALAAAAPPPVPGQAVPAGVAAGGMAPAQGFQLGEMVFPGLDLPGFPPIGGHAIPGFPPAALLQDRQNRGAGPGQQ